MIFETKNIQMISWIQGRQPYPEEMTLNPNTGIKGRLDKSSYQQEIQGRYCDPSRLYIRIMTMTTTRI
eukprot:60830-Ditylum_brightwellii.AAC.1